MPGRQWDAASKAKVVLEGLKGRSESAICKRHRIKPAEYRRWRKQFLANIARPFEPRRAPPAEGSRLLPGTSQKVWEESAKALRVAQELIEALPIPVFFKARDGKHLGANRAWEAYFGVDRESFIGRTVDELFVDAPGVAAQHQAADEDLWRNPGTRSYELEVPVADGRFRHTLNYKATFAGADGEIAGLIGAIIDITERKRAEQRQAIEHRITRILSESETATAAMPGVLAAFCETLGWACGARWSRDAQVGAFRCEETWTEDDPAVAAFLAGSRESTYRPGQAGFIRRVLGTGEPVWIVDVTAEESFLRGKQAAKAGLRSAFALPIRLGDEILGALEFFHRDTQQPDEWLLKTGAAIGLQIGHFMGRTQAERELRHSEARFRSLTGLSSDWYWEQDEEFRLTFMSSRFVERTGIDPEPFMGRRRWDDPSPNLTESDWARHKGQLERHEPFFDFEMERVGPDGISVWLSVTGEPVFEDRKFRGYRGVGTDITERKRAQAVLRAAYDELARSNSELQQFAYVASHDLQEPLRMIGSYTQLLERRYGDKLDGDARDFMGFIVDGATRMKQLIEDLLAYSRVGTRGKELRPVPAQSALDRALANLRAAIESSAAQITHDTLPDVSADDTQLVQLFQNLIGNSIKFRKKEEPMRIHVGVQDAEGEWRFSVADNGIGIEQQYFERIFMVFQRLHTRDEYPGTGIGLAICKKVIDRHRGRIWVESAPGKGSTFVFTLPKIQKGET
ncbi:MAG TPA: ATP-binding protein [Burkholderiales bacterium]|nr:ATP-binding protein [Burkholderiales bacterium]